MPMNYKNLFFLDFTFSGGCLFYCRRCILSFRALPESVYIFTQLGVEPYGRYFSGVIELIAALLILYPKTTGLGAFLSAATMAGAITGHIGVLGIEIEHDGGYVIFF
jgi:putative oxidoreductase